LETTDETQLGQLIQALMPVLKPEQAALLMGHMTSIMNQINERKAKASAMAKTQNGGSNGSAS
jgi:hypothetical protein